MNKTKFNNKSIFLKQITYFFNYKQKQKNTHIIQKKQTNFNNEIIF